MVKPSVLVPPMVLCMLNSPCLFQVYSEGPGVVGMGLLSSLLALAKVAGAWWVMGGEG